MMVEGERKKGEKRREEEGIFKVVSISTRQSKIK